MTEHTGNKLPGDEARAPARRPRLLLVSPCVPYPKAGVRDDNVDYFYYRNTFGQGMFQLRQWHSWHPLHYLAQNLPVPSVVLENATWKRFTAEVRGGAYDVVALTFTVLHARKVLEMVRWLRQEQPAVELILGGYGTVIFSEDLGIEREIERSVDHICRGEGLSFMRRYLAERWDVHEVLPLQQHLVPSRNSLFRSRLTLYRQITFVSALGCENACVFCSTSGHYGHTKTSIARGRELYQLIREEARAFPDVQSAVVYDENFLEDREPVLELMRCMEQDRELQERPFLLTVFASVRAISRFSVEELVRCGIGTIFIGVESFRSEILRGEQLDKRGGHDISTLFAELNDAGINTLGSMVIGWDGHTPENVGRELDAFVALNPTFYQVVPLHPIPATPLWRRIRAEGRLIEGYRYEEDGVARSNFRYRHFDHAQIDALVFATYSRLVEEGGPWPFRLFENLRRGARNLAAHAVPAMAVRGRAYHRMARTVLPLAVLSGLLFRGSGFRARWRRVMGDLWRERPVGFVQGLLVAAVLLPVLGLLHLWGALRFHLSPHGDQPERCRRVYGQEWER